MRVRLAAVASPAVTSAGATGALGDINAFDHVRLLSPSKTLTEPASYTVGRVGGVAYLEQVALTHPQVFVALLGRVLPLTVKGEEAEPVTIQIVKPW